MAVSVIAFASSAFAGLQGAGQTLSGYAPVPGGNFSSAVVVEILGGQSGPTAIQTSITAWDDGVYSDANIACVQTVGAIGGNLVSGAWACTPAIPNGGVSSAISIRGDTTSWFGANYVTISDGGVVKSWSNTIFG